MYISNTFASSVRAIYLYSRTFININVFLKVDFFVIKRLRKFKKRVKFKFEIVIRDVLFK